MYHYQANIYIYIYIYIYIHIYIYIKQEKSSEIGPVSEELTDSLQSLEDLIEKYEESERKAEKRPRW